jgi:hypothetical protein
VDRASGPPGPPPWPAYARADEIPTRSALSSA